MSLLLRQLPAAKRATTCLRRIPLQRLYSSQSAVQLRSDAEHDIPAPHAPETSSEPVNLEADIAPPKRAKVAKAKKSTSKTKKEEAVVDIRDPLEPTNVERYLARIQSEGGEPTLEDLEKFRPEETPRGDSRKYPQKYHALADTLCRSFSRDQLYKFVRLCGLAAKCKGKSPRKLDLAEAIIEHRWDWPNLKEIERARRDREEIVTEGACDRYVLSAQCSIFSSLSRITKCAVLNTWARSVYAFFQLDDSITHCFQTAPTCYSCPRNTTRICRSCEILLHSVLKAHVLSFDPYWRR